MREIIEYKAKELIFILHKIKGAKIITITVQNCNEFSWQETFTIKTNCFDISENGIVGYSPMHEKLFFEQIAFGIENGGGMIVRQFLPEKIDYITNTGKKIKIPKKNIYGIQLGNDSYEIYNSKEVEEVCNTDYSTKERILAEDGVSYQELKIDLLA